MAQLRLCFLLHMHQPDYRDPVTGQPGMPWVRLHAIRSYTDIPWLMEQRPDAAFTINVVPSLLKQLAQVAREDASDPWLDRMQMRPQDMSETDRLFVIDHFFAVNPSRHLPSGSRYRELWHKRTDTNRPDRLAERLRLFTDQDIRDLQVLFQLAWFGFSARRLHPELVELDRKQQGFSDKDRETVLSVQSRLLKDVLPRLRRVTTEGPGECSVSPGTHPILPLLVDSDCARVSTPDMQLPPRVRAPEEARAQIADGIHAGEAWFGKVPAGMWPSEGSVSPAVISFMAEAGLHWFATDEGVGVRSRLADNPVDVWSRPWRFETDAGPITGVFRNRALSDRIGFHYHQSETRDAVDAFMRELEMILKAARHRSSDILLPVILDGENPWENYPDSGYPFLTGILDRVAAHPDIHLAPVTPSIGAVPTESAPGPIHPGSWIDASFRIWIGHPETNLAWSRLGRAIQAVRDARERQVPRTALDAATVHLRAAEGSDWFWWYGDDFESRYKDRFDRLFHAHLAAVYRALDLPEPMDLAEPIYRDTDTSDLTPASALIQPFPHGVDRPLNWRGAGTCLPRGEGGAMHAGKTPVRAIRFGWNTEQLFVRVEPERPLEHLAITLLDGRTLRIQVPLPFSGDLSMEEWRSDSWQHTGQTARVFGNTVPVVALPLDVFSGATGESIQLVITARESGGRDYRIPRSGAIHTGLVLPVDPVAYWWVE